MTKIGKFDESTDNYLSCLDNRPSLLSYFDFKSSLFEIDSMTVNQILEQEIKDSELWLSRTHEESTYKRDLIKRI